MTDVIKTWDYAILDTINNKGHFFLLDIILPVMRNANTWIPLYVALTLYTIYKFRRSSWIYILCIVLAFGISDFVNHELLKPFFARMRPCHHTDLSVRLVLGHCGGLWSFPSSHAANHMAMALTIIGLPLFSGRLSKWLWLCWAGTIGYAQIYVGVHFPTDIIAGFIFGSMVALVIVQWIYPQLNKLHHKFDTEK